MAERGILALVSEERLRRILTKQIGIIELSHDTVYINQFTPSAMIFVPSIGGRSHAEVEETSWADCAAGADVLLHCILKTGNDPETVSYRKN